jgi:hypothetical protein|tara:strand:- start:2233 stop:2577 length:345 start_codon:yes stop_codon:yes gene_type:complete
MKTKHTPGPWIAEEYFVYALNNNNENRFYLSVQAGWGDRHRKIAYRTTNEELEANANLIAAAPDLLKALNECLHLFDEMDAISWNDDSDFQGSSYEGVAEIAEDAVKKAEGENQ